MTGAQWGLRLALAAGVMAIALVRLGEQARPDPIDLLLDRTAEAMRRAGFSAERHREFWPGTRTIGRSLLVARHPACAGPVQVEAMGAMNARRDQRATYIFGGVSGPPPGYVAFAGSALAMAWNHALPWRNTPRPAVTMLAVTDPSACLAVTATDWRWIWFGPDRPHS